MPSNADWSASLPANVVIGGLSTALSVEMVIPENQPVQR
jgi:hypothetical protein